MTSELKFGFFPRFYILCMIKNEMAYKFVEKMRKQLENEKIQIDGIQFIELIPFSFNTFDVLGAIEIRLKELSLEYMIGIEDSKQTFELYSFSQRIEKSIIEINENVEEEVYLDYHNPPYLVSIANATSQGPISWTKENIKAYKKDLGKWIEFYSGQFPDYSDELYDSRIENNLSNRLSELHFIRINSGFIYMNRDDWINRYGEYMEKFFIMQILKTKALLFSFYVLNLEIDKSNKFLHGLADPTLKQLETEIESISKKKVLIDNLNDELIKEQIMNRRAHSKKTLETCLNLFSIPFVREETNYKFQRLQSELDNERAQQQQKFSDSQKKWLLILNILLGSSVIFTIVDKVKVTYLQENLPLYNLLGPNISNFINDFSEPLILGLLGIVAVIGGGGLVYNFLKRKIGFSTIKNFFKKNSDKE
jgi:hypothetical protein